MQSLSSACLLLSSCVVPTSLSLPTHLHSRRRAAAAFTRAAQTDEDAAPHWKSVRARLSRREEQQRVQWAHPIPCLESGSLLVATHTLDSHPLLCRSVVLLLPSSDACFRGLVLNKQLSFPVPENLDPIALSLSELLPAVFYGGPWPSIGNPSVNVLSRENARGVEGVLPGLFLARDAESMLWLVRRLRSGQTRSEDVKAYMGHLEWDCRILNDQINVFQWWHILSCTASSFLSFDSECLWHSLTSQLPFPGGRPLPNNVNTR